MKINFYENKTDGKSRSKKKEINQFRVIYLLLIILNNGVLRQKHSPGLLLTRKKIEFSPRETLQLRSFR